MKFFKKKGLLIALFTAIIITVLGAHKYYSNKQLKTLRIGMNDWCGNNVVMYGMEKGFFAKRGLKIELFKFENLQDATRGMLRGALDLSFTTIWDLMQSDPAEDSPGVFLVTDLSYGADGIVAQPKLKSLFDLTHKKVGAKLGTVNHLILLEALKKVHIAPHEVKIMDLSNESAVKQMYEKKLDGAVLWQPLLGETAKKIQGNILYTTKDQDSLVIDVLASRSQFVAKHQQELTQFILAWFEVMEALENNPSEVFAVVAKKIGQTPESFARDYAGVKKGDVRLNQQMFAPNGKLSQAKAKIITLLEEDLRHNRIIRKDVQLKQQPLSQAIKIWKKT